MDSKNDQKLIFKVFDYEYHIGGIKIKILKMTPKNASNVVFVVKNLKNRFLVISEVQGGFCIIGKNSRFRGPK